VYLHVMNVHRYEVLVIIQNQYCLVNTQYFLFLDMLQFQDIPIEGLQVKYFRNLLHQRL